MKYYVSCDIMDYRKFEKTGTDIPVMEEELIAYIQQKCYNYHDIPEGPDTLNPFKDPIIYKTGDGKLIQIPKHIQEKAISMVQGLDRIDGSIQNGIGNGLPEYADSYYEPSGRNKYSEEHMPPYTQQYPHNRNIVPIQPIIVKESTSSTVLMVLLLLGVFIMYLIYKNNT